MTDFSNALSVAASGMRAQAQRLTHVSENIANADTPGYQRKITSFEAVRGMDALTSALDAALSDREPAVVGVSVVTPHVPGAAGLLQSARDR